VSNAFFNARCGVAAAADAGADAVAAWRA